MLQEKISNLEKQGFKRWTKGDKDRLYVSPLLLGLECDFYKSGHISSARFNGEKISNSKGSRLASVKVFYDLKTDRLECLPMVTELYNTAKEIVDNA